MMRWQKIINLMIESMFMPSESRGRWTMALLFCGMFIGALLFEFTIFKVLSHILIICGIFMLASTPIEIWRLWIGSKGSETIILFLDEANYLKCWLIFILPFQLLFGILVLFLEYDPSFWINLSMFFLGSAIGTSFGPVVLLFYIKINGINGLSRHN